MTVEVSALSTPRLGLKLTLSSTDTTFYYGYLNGKDEQPDYSDVRELYTGF